MAPGEGARSGGRPKSSTKEAAAQEVEKPQEAKGPERVEKAPMAGKVPKAGKEVTVSHETLLRRVKEARGTALVVLALEETAVEELAAK